MFSAGVLQLILGSLHNMAALAAELVTLMVLSWRRRRLSRRLDEVENRLGDRKDDP